MSLDEIIEYKKELNANFEKIYRMGGYTASDALAVAHDVTLIEHIRSKDAQFTSLCNGRWSRFNDKPTGIYNLERLKHDLETAIDLLGIFSLGDLEELTGYHIKDGFILFYSNGGLSMSTPSASMEESLEKIDSLNHLRNSMGLLPLKNMWNVDCDEMGANNQPLDGHK